ncbi:hypothetical protein O0S10_10400, partial [Methanocorpusculum sp. MG]
MKNTKIMAVLVVLLAAALFIGAASAADTKYVAANPNNLVSENDLVQGGEYYLNFTPTMDPTGNTSRLLTKGANLTSVFFQYNIDKTRYLGSTDTAGKITIPSDAQTGVYVGTAMFNPVNYIINVTTDKVEVVTYPTWNKDALSSSGAQEWNVSQSTTSIALRMPNDAYLPVGAQFTPVSNTGAEGIITVQTANGIPYVSTAGVKPGQYKYTTGTNSVQVYVKVVAQGGGGSSTDQFYRNVSSGKDAFVFERINLTAAPKASMLTLYSDGTNKQVINQIAGTSGKFYLTESVVGGHYGNYTYDGGYIYIWYPEISLEAELAGSPGDSVDGKTINKNTEVNFLINSPKVAPVFLNTTTGYEQSAKAKVVFTTPVAGKTTIFGTGVFTDVPLKGTQTGMTAAPTDDAVAGTYTAQAEYIKFALNKDNYDKGKEVTYSIFADYAKKSNTVSFTVQSSTLTITAAKDSVVRSNPFTVTISGDSKKIYKVFIDSASTSEINPTLQNGQSGYQTASDKANDVKYTLNGVEYKIGGNFETDASGQRTIQFNTAANTEDKTYTIKVQGYLNGGDVTKDASLDAGDYDTVKVKVEKGAVTISASGDGSYYIGDEIKLTGTNTDSSLIYLFLTGQNLDDNGIVLKTLPNKYPAMYGNANPVSVKTDNTWEYKWDTSKIALDTGAYTIYATSRITNGKSSSDVTVATDANGKSVDPYVAVKLSDSEYATVSVNLKQPFLSAVPSGTIVAKGDKIYIRGTAEGDPSTLMLYIFGPNFFEDHSITVEDDGTYEKKIEIPSSMSSNQYFVVVQHPMYNGAFDAVLDKTTKSPEWYFHTSNVNTGGDAQAFVVWGSSNKLQGSQAADALTKMIDSANIDDIYTKLTFTVAEPWIKINNPGDKATGSKFTISGTTNLAVDDQILIEVMSSSFTAVDKTSTSTTSGVSQTTKVVAGEGSDNTWSVDVDTTNWKLDEYTIKVNGIEVDVTTTTNFNLVEKLPDTPKPTETGA